MHLFIYLLGEILLISVGLQGPPRHVVIDSQPCLEVRIPIAR
jgi:hypothetical protein